MNVGGISKVVIEYSTSDNQVNSFTIRATSATFLVFTKTPSTEICDSEVENFRNLGEAKRGRE